MSSSLFYFSRKMYRLADQMEENLTNLVKESAKIALDEVVYGTPVDTGRAVSNWVIQQYFPWQGFREEAFVPGKGGSTTSENRARAMAEGLAVIQTYTGKGNAVLHISNNTPYLEELNDKEGFVERAAFRGSVYARHAKVI